MKEAANRIGFGETVVSANIQTPALTRLMRGAHHRRCAREGLTVTHYARLLRKKQGFGRSSAGESRDDSFHEPSLSVRFIRLRPHTRATAFGQLIVAFALFS